MSSPKKVLVIDCGANHVSAGFFNVTTKGVVLQGLEVESIGSEHSGDIEWVAAVSRGLKDINGRRRLSGGNRKVYVIAPGHQLLMKFLKIPHVQKSKRDQIVKFEAQQNIPYPLPEVVWDYEVILDDGAEFEVALGAIKIEIVQGLCNELASLGLEPEIIEPSAMAEFNSFYFSYPETADDASMLINVGGKSTNLLFSDSQGFFVRNVAIAGNNVTQSVAEELSISFDESEELKHRVFAGDEGVSEDQQRAVQLAADSFMRRFSMEATRSVVNFRRQSGREQINKAFLTGGGALVPGLAEHLAEKLKIEVEWYDALRGISVGSKVPQETLDHHYFRMSEMVGAARRAQPGCRTHFNLLPPALARQQAFNRKKTYIVGAAAVLVAAAFLPIYSFNTVAETYDRQSVELERELEPLRQFDSDIQANLGRADEIRAEVETVSRLVESKDNWVVLLNDLQERLVEVEDVWLDEVRFAGQNRRDRSRQQRSRGGLFDAAPAQEQADTGDRLRLTVSGRLIDRENPLSRVSPESQARVQSLLASFSESEFISTVENERFDPSDGILGFDFVLVLDPDHAL